MDLKSLSRAVLSAALATSLSAAPALAESAVPVRPGAVAPKAPPAVKPSQEQPPAVKPIQEAPPQDAKVKAPRPEIEVVFVLDTTGSMSGLLEGAKAKIYSIASRIAQGRPTPHLKVGLVAYRDVGDDYVTKRFDLSDDLDTVFANLRRFEAGGGGDTPEHVGRGLGEAVSKLSWNQDRSVMKAIFLVGDAPPAKHNDDWDFKHWAKRAREQHIVVNTVRCGSDEETQTAWKYVAKLTDGTFDSIDQSGGMVAVATPYDAELAKVNSALASKTLYTGKAEVQTANKARAEAMAELAPEAAAERISYMRKTSGSGSPGAPAPSSAPKAVGGAVDLVSAPAALASVRDDELPSELKGLSVEGRAKKVKQLADEKKDLETQASKLAAEREAWLAKNRPEKEDAFDANVMKGVKAQAAKHGVAY
ncbi:VWA domain-containing protein [Myxococcus sp. CA056]|uniref:vWA domain-containing protein n=1 Tax=unclassified Myxococcus TaxID=2648731 RepID=UPI00157B8582|nr:MULTISPECIES: vWA domain-containing protein [unclassified Myxococcus]NTX15336.1 VWA domain-containing protein [Myxococcus sp. CA056]NTX37910.1 VWA domain-containing protein [Myxococcus sp. CA033]